MKKIIALCLILCAIFTLASCGKCEHDYQEEITTEATCAAVGTKTFTCSLCEDSYTEEIPMVEHNYEFTTTKAATCTEDGEQKAICTGCGIEGDTETLAATGHSWTGLNCTNPKHCEYCGITEGEPLGHHWSPTEPSVCFMCGITEGSSSSQQTSGGGSGSSDNNNGGTTSDTGAVRTDAEVKAVLTNLVDNFYSSSTYGKLDDLALEHLEENLNTIKYNPESDEYLSTYIHAYKIGRYTEEEFRYAINMWIRIAGPFGDNEIYVQ